MGRKPKKKDIAEYLWHSEPTKINATNDNWRIRYGYLDSEGKEHQTTETVNNERAEYFEQRYKGLSPEQRAELEAFDKENEELWLEQVEESIKENKVINNLILRFITGEDF